ncbi:MAG: HAD family hydrolase, partial [Pseudomonadota bacterium]
LDRAQGAKVLSLDCFDTLLWRDCHAPSDVFEALPGIVPGQRAAQEVNARKAEAVLRGRNEVSIEQIYGQVLPNADARQRANAIDAELAAEASACFAFGPTVQLMRTAKANGLKVIIVSDTYFDERQLRDLIAAAAGQEVADLIDRFFASSTAGVSKSQGMLAKVLKAIKCRPCEVLHIGDNRSADYDGARALGIPALHLVQFSEATKQRLRFERTCQQLIGDARGEIRGLQPHRALLSKGEAEVGDPAEALGFSVLGPVFHAYEAWLQEEAAALQRERGGTVHWLFLLRDGHLPHAVHCLGASVSSAHRVEISRFTATAASLTTNEAIDRHIALEHGLNPSTLARQMLFTEQEIEQVCGGRDMAQASQALLAELRSGQRKKLIKRRAREQSARLAEHVRSTANPAPGDTLMLVDLGYNGSAQNRIDAFLSETFDVHVAGRYLLLREMAATGHDKKGLIDQRHFDPQMLEAMCGNVAVLEQLATTTMGSVTNYTSAGEPIRKESAVKGKQSQVRDRVQAGCLSFCKQALSPPVIRVEEQTKQRGWRDAAASSLTRFMFLPQAAELGVVKSFEHDVNLGSERMVALFDPSVAKEGMRRRGLFYMKGSSRMYLPAELASEDMNTRLSLLAQKRFGLSL